MEDNGGELAEIPSKHYEAKVICRVFLLLLQGHEMAGHLPVNVAIFQTIFCTNNPVHE